jgi:hypothetical protein
MKPGGRQGISDPERFITIDLPFFFIYKGSEKINQQKHSGRRERTCMKAVILKKV